MDARTKPDAGTDLVYSPTARALHWVTVLAIAIMIPAGLYMVWRGDATNFDATTNTLYSAHKLAGFLVLWLVVLRLGYRFVNGAPADEPTLKWYEKAAAHATHWSIYLLLLAVPMLGWLGVSLYDSRDVLGGFRLPSITPVDKVAAERAFATHYWAAMALVALVGMHIGAAMFHHVIRGDGVLRRMLPGLKRRGE